MTHHNSRYRVILVAMLKGGVRKTTTATMLAFAMARKGRNVTLIDTDLLTQGVTEWISQAAADMLDVPFDTVQWSPGSGGLLVPFVQRTADEMGSDVVIIDAGAELPHVIQNALPITDLVLMPVGPDQAEVSRLAPTASLVQRRAGVPAAVVLTRVDAPRQGAALALRTQLTAANFRVLDTEVPRSREKYAHVFGTCPDDLGAYDPMADEVLAAVTRQHGAVAAVR